MLIPKVRVYRKSETACPIDERNVLLFPGVSLNRPYLVMKLFIGLTVVWMKRIYSRFPVEGGGISRKIRPF